MRRKQHESGTQHDAPLLISRAALRDIHREIGSRACEHGGILGGSRDDDIVTHFHFDRTAARSAVTYTPDYRAINTLLAERWNPDGVSLLGFVHSHPPAAREPSRGDLVYARRILERCEHLDRLLIPIVLTEPDAGGFRLLPYALVRTGDSFHLQMPALRVVEDGSGAGADAEPGAAAETFSRVERAYDLSRLSGARMIYVGVGGAAAFAEDMARAGVAQHVLIDPDVVEEPNLATQQVYRRDLGRPKVACVAERILDINPRACVVAEPCRLDDIDDAGFRALARGPIGGRQPEVTLLCGFTDSFAAQARVNRLALHFGLPSLCAQVYREGRAGEITFTHPEITPACHRCMLSARYRAYLEQGFDNDVTSHGTPIFATARINALKGFIALAILHAGTPHPRWGSLLARIGSRSLIQIRLDPDLHQTLGLGVFERVLAHADQERLLFDEVVWLPQVQECPATGYPRCPDCLGSGNLGNAIGTFDDTRTMRR